MKLKFLTCLVLAAAVALSVTALPACGSRGSPCVLEAENAVLEPEYDEDIAEVTRANSRSEYITGGGKFAGKMYAGSTATWFFTADRQTECRIRAAVANADPTGYAFTAGERRVFTVSLNGDAVDIPEFVIDEGTQYCDNWQILDLGTFTVKAGVNTLVYTALSDGERLNIDYVAVTPERGQVKEHSHFWKNSVYPATCTDEGYSRRYCDDCGYSYVSDLISPLGHIYGNFHYSDELLMMVSQCERCGDAITANAPDSDYFGEVFYDEDEFSVRPDELVFEAEEAYVCTAGGLNNGDTYIKEDDGSCNSPSGGKLVENISKAGNYILFNIEAERPCTADLVFRMSNTLYSADGIAGLDPMGDYVYCTVNGVQVDFTFVSFPGFDEHSYFEWRYVVIKNVRLQESNRIEIGPKDGGRRITMPNADVLKVYTDGVELRAVKHYDINGVTCGEYSGRYSEYLDFESSDGFVLYAGVPVNSADYVLTVQAEEDIPVAAGELALDVNGSTVNLEGISLKRGVNIVVLEGVPVELLENVVAAECSQKVKVLSVRVYTGQPLPPACESAIVPSNDYLGGGGRQPSLIYEAEDADLGDSVSSRDGVELIERYIYENTGASASGNGAIGNFAVAGNTITWRFSSSGAAEADITVMLASAYFDADVNGNVATHDLQDKIILRINGVAADLGGIVLEVDSVANYYCWQAVTVSGITLKEGINTVTIEALAYGAPNMDVLYVYSQDASLAAAA